MKNPFHAVLAFAASWLMAAQAKAAQPVEWQLGFQPAATDIMREITWFNNYTLWFITPITILVLILLVIVIVRYHKRTNPNPSRTSHNTAVEVLWTVGPIIILLALAIRLSSSSTHSLIHRKSRNSPSRLPGTSGTGDTNTRSRKNYPSIPSCCPIFIATI